MPLTDAKIRALHGKALKGEIVGKAADGGGLNFKMENTGGCPTASTANRRRWLWESIPT